MSKRKRKRSASLVQLLKAHARACEQRDRLVEEASKIVKIPKPLDKAVRKAHDAAAKSFSALCHYHPRNGEELLQWLSAVLGDAEVTAESIRVLDGLAALTGAHNALGRLLVPASYLHPR